jgi:hypothetical protein
MTGGRLPGYGPQLPSQADLWRAQDAPCIANEAGCTDAVYDRLVLERQQTEAAYLARIDAELARELEAESPEPEPLPDPDPEVGGWLGWSDPAMLAPDLEPEPEAEP